MKLTITEADNGYYLEKEGENYGTVIQLDEHKKEDGYYNREKVQELLYEVLDYFSERGSKHDEYRTVIEVQKQ